MPIVVNNIQLQARLLTDAEEIITEVSQKILKALRQSILTNTYKYDYFPNHYYYNESNRPTFQFLKAWLWNDIRWINVSRNIKRLVKNLSYEPMKTNMSLDPATWLHGSFAGDARGTLQDILNNPYRGDGQRTSSLALGRDDNDNLKYLSKKRKPYWDIFIEDMFTNGKIRLWTRQAATAKGYRVF